jgi:hypothetical protein
MPYFKALYKTEADPDGRLWPIGPLPDRDHALEIFNSIVSKEKIGPFTFKETSDFLPYYNLLEQETPNGPEIMFPLYKSQ